MATSVLEMVVNDSGRAENVGPYRVLGLLGKGGMGIVYEVEHQTSGARFALKTIETRFLQLESTNAGRRFTQEIGVLKKLDHNGVVRLYDYGFAKHPMGYELAFFVMEKIAGETLEERIKREPKPTVDEALNLVASVTEAIGYLSEHGVLHRDIKPANLMVEPDGRVVLMDFGLARSNEFTRLTQAGHIIGTLAYMSPEALRGDERTGTASDVFALGAVLHEVLVGQPPFLERDPTARVRAIKKGLIFPPDFNVGPYTEDVRGLISAMLAYRVADRPGPQEVIAMAEQLMIRVGGALPSSLARASTRAAPGLSQVSSMAEGSDPSDLVRVDAPPAGLGASSAKSAASAHISQPRSRQALFETKSQPQSAAPEDPSRLFQSEIAEGAAISPPPPKSSSTRTLFVVAVCSGVAFALGFGVKTLNPPKAPPPKVIKVPMPVPVKGPAKAAPKKDPPRPLPAFKSAEEAFGFGDRSLRDKRYHVAIRALQKSLELNPANAKVYRRLGDAHLAVGELEAAKSIYKTYIALGANAEPEEAKRVEALINKL